MPQLWGQGRGQKEAELVVHSFLYVATEDSAKVTMRGSSPCASQRDVCTQYRHQGEVQLFIQAKASRDGRVVGVKQKGELGVGG